MWWMSGTKSPQPPSTDTTWRAMKHTFFLRGSTALSCFFSAWYIPRSGQNSLGVISFHSMVCWLWYFCRSVQQSSASSLWCWTVKQDSSATSNKCLTVSKVHMCSIRIIIHDFGLRNELPTLPYLPDWASLLRLSHVSQTYRMDWDIFQGEINFWKPIRPGILVQTRQLID